MLVGKQRRFLRAIGATLDPIVHVGKGGISEHLVRQVDEALEARELVKIRVLANFSGDSSGLLHELTITTGAELVQQMGRNALLYRRSTKKPVIELP